MLHQRTEAYLFVFLKKKYLLWESNFWDVRFQKGPPQSCFQLDEAKGIIFLEISDKMGIKKHRKPLQYFFLGK